MSNPFRLWIAGMMLLALMGGCSPKPDVTASAAPDAAQPEGATNGSSPSGEGTSVPPPPPPLPGPPGPAKGTGDSDPAAPKGGMLSASEWDKRIERERPKNVHQVVPAGSSGWSLSKKPALQIAAEADRATASLSNALGQANLYLTTPAGRGNVKTMIQVDSGGKYHIEYNLQSRLDRAQDMMAVNRLVSDGTTKTRQEDRKWEGNQPVKAPWPDAGDQAGLKWIKSFQRNMFDPLTAGQSGWAKALEGLQAEGFAVSAESKSQMVLNKMKPFYRLVARRKGSHGLDEIEAVFDGDRWLPVTVRVNLHPTKSETTEVQWNGRWAFGGKHDPSLFKVPKG